jgi:hypothetical protein
MTEIQSEFCVWTEHPAYWETQCDFKTPDAPMTFCPYCGKRIYPVPYQETRSEG